MAQYCEFYIPDGFRIQDSELILFAGYTLYIVSYHEEEGEAFANMGIGKVARFLPGPFLEHSISYSVVSSICNVV